MISSTRYHPPERLTTSDKVDLILYISCNLERDLMSLQEGKYNLDWDKQQTFGKSEQQQVQLG
jgi:hypothetical protein